MSKMYKVSVTLDAIVLGDSQEDAANTFFDQADWESVILWGTTNVENVSQDGKLGKENRDLQSREVWGAPLGGNPYEVAQDIKSEEGE